MFRALVREFKEAVDLLEKADEAATLKGSEDIDEFTAKDGELVVWGQGCSRFVNWKLGVELKHCCCSKGFRTSPGRYREWMKVNIGHFPKRLES